MENVQQVKYCNCTVKYIAPQRLCKKEVNEWNMCLIRFEISWCIVCVLDVLGWLECATYTAKTHGMKYAYL